MKQTISNRQGKQLAVYTDCLKDAPVLVFSNSLGTTNANQPNVNPETLIEWNPDNIVLWNTNPKLIYERKELQGLSAVQNRKVFNLSPAFIYNPHTIKIIITAIYLNHSIYPEQSDLPVSALQQRILTKLYGEQLAKVLMQ